MPADHSIKSPAIVYIYGLTDPRTKAIRYVGKAENLQRRFKAHIDRAVEKKTHCQRWITSLARDGIRPVLMVLEETTEEKWKEAECWWIDWLRSQGFDLTNTYLGGFSGPVDSETRAKMSAIKKGKKPPWLHTPEVYAKSAAARTGKKRKPCSEERRQKVREAHLARIGIPLTAEHRQKISEAKMGHSTSPELKEKLRLANLGRKASEETKAKQRAAGIARYQSQESRQQAIEAGRKSWVTRRSRLNAKASKQQIWKQGTFFDFLQDLSE